ncbi:MAG: TetR/AcrR family transcriptional regulator [Erysipelothrix sp.]|nr:TetR/AcrR family transcriptional regulator [Erysipelothrix sp.]
MKNQDKMALSSKYKSLVNKPKTKRGQITLDKLIKSAEKNFLANGFYNTTINNITHDAGVGLGTFYVYFDEKLSIYKYLLSQYSYQIRKQIAINVGATKDRKEAEKIGLKSFLDYIKENPHIYHIIWESLYIDQKLFVDYYTEFANSYIVALDEAFKNGQIKKYDNEVVAYMLMGVSNFIGLRWIIFDDVKDFSKIVDEAIEVLDKGLFTDK